MYNEILLFPEKLRGQPIYPDIARKIVGEACDGCNIDPAIFCHDAQGKTLQGRYGDDRKGEGFGIPPAIIFDGGTGFIRIFGIGQSGSDLLADQAMPMVSALNKHFGGAFRMEMKQGDMTLSASEPRIYNMRHLVVAKKAHQIAQFRDKSVAERSEEIKKEILNGLLSCARFLDDDIGGASMLEGQIPSHESLTLDILEGTPMPVFTKPGIPAAAYKNLVFCTNLKLSGPWTAGKLRSRGYGLIRQRIER